MPNNVLEKIIERKKGKIESLKETISLESLKVLISSNKTFVNFKEKIEHNIKNNKNHEVKFFSDKNILND